MKKILLTGLFITLLLNGTILPGYSDDEDMDDDENQQVTPAVNFNFPTITNGNASSQDINDAIAFYKEGNYLSCISTLKEYIAQIDDDAVAWYYLGSAYMNIDMKGEAKAAFDRVIEINSSSQLTSFAVQAQLCIKDSSNCKYINNFTPSQVERLVENPLGFLKQYYEALNKPAETKSYDVIQIENLINGTYPDNIHTDAQIFIETERTKIKASQINSGDV